MNDYDLIRRDNEYQKEIRRQKMTDAAKIGLLVTQNVQQFQSNQILAHLQSEACRTNQFLGHMAIKLDQVAEMQASHFEQVQRERSLKEVMFQFGKFLDEAEAYGDPVAAAFGMKRLFDVLDRPENGFSTADLSDLSEKRLLESLISRSKELLTKLPSQQMDELGQFEKLLGVYLQRREQGFQGEKAFPKRKPKELPLKFGTPPVLEPIGLVTLSDVSEQLTIAGFRQWYTSAWVGRQNLLIQIVVWVYSAGVGVFLWFFITLLMNHKSAAASANEADHRLKVEQWEKEKAEAEQLLAAENLQINQGNEEIEKRRRNAKQIFDATMADMRSLINSFLDQHPLVQGFVARV